MYFKIFILSLLLFYLETEGQNGNFLSRNKFIFDSIIIGPKKLIADSDLIYIYFGKSKIRKHADGYKVHRGKITLTAKNELTDVSANVSWIHYSFRNDSTTNLSFHWPDDHKANQLGKYKYSIHELFSNHKTLLINKDGVLILSLLSFRKEKTIYYLHKVN